MPRRAHKVAFVAHSPWLAGAEIALANLLEHLPVDRIEPVAVFPAHDGPVKQKVRDALKIPVFDLPYLFSVPVAGSQQRVVENAARQVPQFQALYRELEVDGVVVNTSVIYPAVAAAVRSGLPVILHCHGIISERLFPGLDGALWSRIDHLQMSMAHLVIVPSEAVKRGIAQLHGLESIPIRVIPNGTVLPAKESLGPDDGGSGTPEFVMLCTLEPNKGVEHFLESARHVLRERPQGARFSVYGDGAPAYVESLRAAVAEAGLSDSFRILPKQTDVASIYRRCFAVVVASKVESFSYVAIEAMSYARPVIATLCGGPEDIVGHGATGFLIPVGDVAALAGSMKTLLDDPALARRLGEEGRVRAELRFDIRSVARVFEETLCEALQEQSGGLIASLRRALASELAFPLFAPEQPAPVPPFPPDPARASLDLTGGLAPYERIFLQTVQRLVQNVREVS